MDIYIGIVKCIYSRKLSVSPKQKERSPYMLKLIYITVKQTDYAHTLPFIFAVNHIMSL